MINLMVMLSCNRMYPLNYTKDTCLEERVSVRLAAAIAPSANLVGFHAWNGRPRSCTTVGSIYDLSRRAKKRLAERNVGRRP